MYIPRRRQFGAAPRNTSHEHTLATDKRRRVRQSEAGSTIITGTFNSLQHTNQNGKQTTSDLDRPGAANENKLYGSAPACLTHHLTRPHTAPHTQTNAGFVPSN